MNYLTSLLTSFIHSTSNISLKSSPNPDIKSSLTYTLNHVMTSSLTIALTFSPTPTPTSSQNLGQKYPLDLLLSSSLNFYITLTSSLINIRYYPTLAPTSSPTLTLTNYITLPLMSSLTLALSSYLIFSPTYSSSLDLTSPHNLKHGYRPNSTSFSITPIKY